MVKADCVRCDHSSDWHRLDDALNIGPTDPRAQFRCLGFDPSAGGSPERRCDCPDMAISADMFWPSERGY
jgi:hypothetical protein